MVELDLEVKYTVMNISSTAMILGFSSTIEVKGQGVEMQGMSVVANLEGAQQGAATVNVATGWLISNESVQNMNGDIEAQGMKIPVEMRATYVSKGE